MEKNVNRQYRLDLNNIRDTIHDILDWFEDTDFEMEYLDGDGQFDKELFIEDFKNRFL